MIKTFSRAQIAVQIFWCICWQSWRFLRPLSQCSWWCHPPWVDGNRAQAHRETWTLFVATPCMRIGKTMNLSEFYTGGLSQVWSGTSGTHYKILDTLKKSSIDRGWYKCISKKSEICFLLKNRKPDITQTNWFGVKINDLLVQRCPRELKKFSEISCIRLHPPWSCSIFVNFNYKNWT